MDACAGNMAFGCAGPPDALTPQPQHPVSGHGGRPKPCTSRFDLNAGNAAPTQIPTFTQHGHMTYRNAAFQMLVAVLPTTRPNSKPDVTILLRGDIEGR